MSDLIDPHLDRMAETMSRLFRAMMRMGQVARGHVDLTPQQIGILAQLCEDGPKTISELRQCTASAQSTTSEIVARLAKSGLVLKKHSREDSRVVMVIASARGKALFEEQKRFFRSRHRALLERLSNLNRERLVAAMEMIESLVTEAADAPSPVEVADKEEP